MTNAASRGAESVNARQSGEEGPLDRWWKDSNVTYPQSLLVPDIKQQEKKANSLLEKLKFEFS